MTDPAPVPRVLRVAMNGVTGRMGYRQHLLRSILPLREAGGLELPDGSRVQVEPILVGRNEAKLRDLAQQHEVEHWTHRRRRGARRPVRRRLLRRPGDQPPRVDAAQRPCAAGKHVFTEKPTAETLAEAVELARLAREAGITAGVVHDKLYLPGLVKLRRLVDEGFFGRILSLRGEFGYWVFEGDFQPAQRPSLELPRRGRRRHHHRHVLPLELRARGHPRPGPQRHGARRHPHPAPAGTSRASRTRPPPTTPRTASSSSRRPRATRSSPRSTPPGRSGCTATSWSSSRSTAPTARPSPACRTASPSSARTPRSRCGTPTCRSPSRSATSGSRCPPTPTSTTASSCSGRSSCATSSPAGRTASACCPPRAACSWPSSACGPPPRAAPSTIPAIDAVTARCCCPAPDGSLRRAPARRPRPLDPAHGRPLDLPGRLRRRTRRAAAAGRQHPRRPGGPRLGRHAGLPPRAVVLRARRRRRDGHRPARDGPGLGRRPRS